MHLTSQTSALARPSGSRTAANSRLRSRSAGVVFCSRTQLSEPQTNAAHTANALGRREALGAAVLAGLTCLSLNPSDAQAGPVGDAAVAWWLGRQRANFQKIIAPIKVAQTKLQKTRDGIQAASTQGSLTEVLQTVRSSSLNCYIFDALPEDSLETRASLATQQYQLSDPCTFRLIVKNVTQLYDEDTRQEGQQLVASLILSYQKLDGELDMAIGGNPDALPRAQTQLDKTMDLLNQLEGFVANILTA